MKNKTVINQQIDIYFRFDVATSSVEVETGHYGKRLHNAVLLLSDKQNAKCIKSGEKQ